MNSHTITARRQGHRDFAGWPLSAPLPRGLRDEAAGLSWGALLATYAPAAGSVRLGHWECADSRRVYLGPQARKYRATIAIGERITTTTAAAAGPIGALTAMLHDCGVAVEMLNFHQADVGGRTVTFIRGSDGVRSRWALGLDADPTESALRAVIACANRLRAPGL